MNQKKAKALRKALGFHPHEPREYKVSGAALFFTGHHTATGPRRNYQQVKRNAALTRMVLAAPKLEAAHG